MMRVTLLLLCSCAATTVLAVDDGFAGRLLENQASHSLYSFKWMSEDEQEASLRVCLLANATEELSQSFVLTYNNAENEEFSVPSGTPEMLDDELFCGTVTVNSATLSYSTEQVYMVNSDEVLAVANFRMNIQPSKLSIESLIAANATIITGLTNYSVDGCGANSDSSCILFDNSDPSELCTRSDDSLNPGLSILVCDSTFAVVIVNAKTEGTKTRLVYDDCNVQVTTASADTSTLQVFISDFSDDSYAPCEESVCVAASCKGTSIYSLLVVEQNSTQQSISSDRITMQDLSLTVVDTTHVVDFYLANKHDERMYEIFSNTTADNVFDGQAIFLDCSQINDDVPCYAFVTNDDTPQYLGVRYNDQTNEVVTKIYEKEQ